MCHLCGCRVILEFEVLKRWTRSQGSGNNFLSPEMAVELTADALPPEERQENAEPPLDEIISLFTAEGDTKQMFSPSIQPELAACWTKILISGLATETKENLIKTYLPPENCQELSAPLINPEVKRASPENSVRRDARIAQIQQQEGSTAEWATTSCSQQPSEELSADQTFPASNWKAGQGQRQEVSSITLEVGTSCGRLNGIHHPLSENLSLAVGRLSGKHYYEEQCLETV
ncbi:unnamed protein product [Callosobruchus maculatus]|uniref:Uncharacterized protein n=1 Tax=Callosobruchus maculatus TaxID=64391 RepID=A0A653DAF8_CALMS|nr:unnamed protein product [Callosobruchus maculatus]